MASSSSTAFLETNAFQDNRKRPQRPSNVHEIQYHNTGKKYNDDSYDVRGTFVHFAHHGLRNVVQFQDLMEQRGVRHFLHKSRWYDRPSMVSLRKIMNGRIVFCLSFLNLLVAIFSTNMFELLAMKSNLELDMCLTISFSAFVVEMVATALSNRIYPLSFYFFMDLLGTLSMVFDISYLLGPDCSQPQRLEQETGNDRIRGVLLLRATRAVRIGARAGRVSRVAKIMRIFSQSNEEEATQDQVKMANVISNKLQDVLSVRVAFLVICIAVVLPSLGTFEYPEVEESMTAWAGLLADAADDHYKTDGGDHLNMLDKELRRFSKFYSTSDYGPFLACYHPEGRPRFEEQREELWSSCSSFKGSEELVFETNFTRPLRGSWVMISSAPNVDLFYDVAIPQRLEAIMGMSLIVFIILVMVVFSMILSANISTVAIAPLERMLSVVRLRCAQIFKYTKDLQEDQRMQQEEGWDFEDLDAEKSNEFALLEKAVSKLGTIASLSAATTITAPEEMTETDLMVMNWMQGRHAGNEPSAAPEDSVRASTALSAASRSKSVFENEDTAFYESLMKNVPAELIQQLRTTNFDAFEQSTENQIAVSVHVMMNHESCAEFVRMSVPPTLMLQFVVACEAEYPRNPFHCFSHAVDVVVTSALFMTRIEASNFLQGTAQFAVLVAGFGHDLGHPALNNAFLIETANELALTYNDRSPLENFHCCKLFQILSEADNNILRSLKKEAYKDVRKQIIEAILHTDVIKHNEMVKELNLLYQMRSEAFDSFEPTEEGIEILTGQSQMMLNAILHTADVGNPMKPWQIAQKLAYLCVDEFFAQGDQEKELGIPVQMLNDREKVNRANSQIGFIEFMVFPLVEAVVQIFPQLDFLSFHIGQNLKSWAKLWETEVQPPQDQLEKVKQRVSKVFHRSENLLQDQVRHVTTEVKAEKRALQLP